MFAVYLIHLLLVICFAKPETDLNYPVPPRIATTTPEPERLTHANGCEIKIQQNHTIICTGLLCYNFTTPETQQPWNLYIKTTRISTIHRDDFIHFKNLYSMELQFNLELERFEPGCFRTLHNLTKLHITYNHNLKYLDENVFEGLTNLQQLVLHKNAFTSIYDITKTLSVKYMPSLLRLSMNENVFRQVHKNDFEVMQGSTLQELRMILCQIDYIHPESFNVLKNMTTLFLGQNTFQSLNIENLLEEMIKNKIPVRYLSLDETGLKKSSFRIYQLIDQLGVEILNISHNVFDNLNTQSFPKMVNIKVLDLSGCLLLDIANGTFDSLPNLEALLLNENRFVCVSPGMTVKYLKKLDLSENSGNPITRSYFHIDDNSFINMSKLIELKLAYNLISQLSSATFNGLTNLKYLGLKNATIFSMDQNSFGQLRSLQYLNLESNKFTIGLNADIFKGLSELKILLLGECSLEHLNASPSVFTYLPKLEFLGLQGNCLYALESALFEPVSNLAVLVLAQNKLIEWTDVLLPNSSLRKLDLGQNKIKKLTVNMLEDFKHLEKLNLDGNPFTCDCTFDPVEKWFSERNYSPNFVVSTYTATCVSPDEWGQNSIFNYLLYLHSNPNKCAILGINSQIILITVLIVISVILIFSSVLGYYYRSYIRHWVLLARMAFRRYWRWRKKNSFEEQGQIYKYDAFVSYSNEDQEFVVNLITKLEDSEPFFKLCVYERDFQIGSAISESVLHSVASSKRTLLIVSDSFAKSQWCRWEAKLAEHHHLFFQDGDIKGPYGTLLIILLGDVEASNMTPTLRYLLKTRIYLQWSSEPDKEHIFWEKLRKKLMSSNFGVYESRM